MTPKLKKLTIEEAKSDVFSKDANSILESDIVLKVQTKNYTDKKTEPLLNLEITLQECNRKGFFASK